MVFKDSAATELEITVENKLPENPENNNQKTEEIITSSIGTYYKRNYYKSLIDKFSFFESPQSYKDINKKDEKVKEQNNTGISISTKIYKLQLLH